MKKKKNLDFIDPDEGRAPGINPAMSQQGGWRVGGWGVQNDLGLTHQKRAGASHDDDEDVTPF